MWLNLLVDDCKCGNTTKLIGKKKKNTGVENIIVNSE